MLCARWGGDAPSVSSSSGDDAHRSLLEISQPAPDTDTQNEGGRTRASGRDRRRPRGLKNRHGEKIQRTQKGGVVWTRPATPHFPEHRSRKRGGLRLAESGKCPASRDDGSAGKDARHP